MDTADRFLLDDLVLQFADTESGLLAFTCIRRRLCPACHQRIVRSNSDWIPTAVCHEVPHRQFVFTSPRVLRGIRNETEAKRKAKTLVERDEQSKSQGHGGLTVLQQCIQRLTQRTVKFIRWLKNHLDSERSWRHALARLVKIYARS